MRGEGFMSYKAAEVRLRRALIPMLTGAHYQPAIGVRGIFSALISARCCQEAMP
jgi:hypothetical protein